MLMLLMSNSDLFDKLYQEINRQNTFYFWIVGITLSIAIAITAFLGILQWRLSDKQIDKMKNDTKKEVVQEYQLDSLNKRLGDLEKEIKELESKAQSFNLESTGNFKIPKKAFERSMALTKKLEIQSLITKLSESDDTAIKDVVLSIEQDLRDLLSYDGASFLDNAVFIYDIYSELLKHSDKNYATELIDFLESNAGDLIERGKEIKNTL